MPDDLIIDSGTWKVFISYSWDSDEHKAWVLTFADRLRNDGIDTILDQTHLHFGGRTPEFMDRSVRDSRSVLVICTEAYKQRFDGRKGGAGYEGHIITAEILSSAGTNKFIPVLRQGDWTTAMQRLWAASMALICAQIQSRRTENLCGIFMVCTKFIRWGAPRIGFTRRKQVFLFRFPWSPKGLQL